MREKTTVDWVVLSLGSLEEKMQEQTEMWTEPMKGRKKMLLIECFPDVRFSAKALFFYFTHTSKFLLNDTVVTNCRSQN